MSGKVWKYVTEKLASEGACHFSLLDPDPLSTSIENVVEQAILVEKAGSDAIMIGGSTIFGVIDEAVAQIGEAVGIPTILFPGNITGVSGGYHLYDDGSMHGSRRVVLQVLQRCIEAPGPDR